MPIHYLDHSSRFAINEIRIMTCRAFLFGLSTLTEEEKKALKDLQIVTDELSIMGERYPAPFTETGLVLARSIAKQFCDEAASRYRE